MNIKPGDLCILVKSHAGNEGKIVTAVEHIGPMRIRDITHKIDITDVWRVTPLLPDCFGYLTDKVPTSCLRPIKDQPGEDETIEWAGKPSEIKQAEHSN